MQTFKKLPIHAPKQKIINMNNGIDVIIDIFILSLLLFIASILKIDYNIFL